MPYVSYYNNKLLQIFFYKKEIWKEESIKGNPKYKLFPQNFPFYLEREDTLEESHPTSEHRPAAT